MRFDDGIPAIPLWIDGHAWSGVFEEFIDVREADGEVRYRVPQCGPDEAATAVASARRAQPAWAADAAGRQRLLGELAGLLDQFGGDFAKLVGRETGKDVDGARAEVARAVDALRQAAGAAAGGGVQAVASDGADPLASAAAGLAGAYAAGAAAVVLSDARAPSAVFALAELSARAGFPAGALCLLHGDPRARAALESALAG
ncbi:MAG: aldehyde dehydrogenase family protein [Rhodocyclaceae bacterium]|nr:aldehyde dehydrogenase family protein [Rhodocyclaceae bacterium]